MKLSQFVFAGAKALDLLLSRAVAAATAPTAVPPARRLPCCRPESIKLASEAQPFILHLG